MNNWRDPVHPGEILAGELKEIGLNASQLADKLGVARNVYILARGFALTNCTRPSIMRQLMRPF